MLWGNIKFKNETSWCYIIDKDKFKYMYTKLGTLGEGSFAVVDKY